MLYWHRRKIPSIFKRPHLSGLLRKECILISYVDNLDGISPGQLRGFFLGWPNPPSPETHLEILKRSSALVLAVDGESGRVVGFVNAISDGILSAYIPLLEVLPEYRILGLGRELMTRLLRQLEGLYMIDLVCDIRHVAGYEQFGMRRMNAMCIRNFAHQAGRAAD
jgi:ribosomal protein S18 acetylase RimI-like enzyme